MPKLAAFALLGVQLLAIAAFAAPVAAAPCYQQGQPAPPSPPNTAALQSNCQTAANNVQTALLVGAYGGAFGTYGVQKYADRMIVTTIGPGGTSGAPYGGAQAAYATCAAEELQDSGGSSVEGILAALRRCPASTSNFLGCIEHDQAPVGCARAHPGRVAAETDKFLANIPFLCMITAAGFAPSTTGTPVPAPAAACLAPLIVAGSTQQAWPPVGAAWSKAYALLP